MHGVWIFHSDTSARKKGCTIHLLGTPGIEVERHAGRQPGEKLKCCMYTVSMFRCGQYHEAVNNDLCNCRCCHFGDFYCLESPAGQSQCNCQATTDKDTVVRHVLLVVDVYSVNCCCYRVFNLLQVTVWGPAGKRNSSATMFSSVLAAPGTCRVRRVQGHNTRSRQGGMRSDPTGTLLERVSLITSISQKMTRNNTDHWSDSSADSVVV